MGLRGIPKLVSASETEVKFFYKGLHVQRPGDSGKWKMSVYGSDTDNSGREDLIEVDQILSQADQDAGYDVNFKPDAVLTGMNGCSGGNNYACFIVYKGEAQKNTGCLKFSPDCRGNNSKYGFPHSKTMGAFDKLPWVNPAVLTRVGP